MGASGHCYEMKMFQPRVFHIAGYLYTRCNEYFNMKEMVSPPGNSPICFWHSHSQSRMDTAGVCALCMRSCACMCLVELKLSSGQNSVQGSKDRSHDVYAFIGSA